MERGSLNLVRIIEELLEWKGSGSGSRKSRLYKTPELIVNIKSRNLGKYDWNR
jgi:hypothetical protein